jgi:oligopeptide transport system permease protein
MSVAMIGVSIPNFVLAPLLILVFSVGLGWFASGDWNSWQDSILPSFSLGLYYTAYIARLTRSGVLDVIRQDFIRTARAKGLTERVVILRHALSGALLPVVSYMGPAAASVLTGSVVIEKVFNVPGLGTFFVDAAFNRDYFLVLGVLIVYSALLVAMNIAVDVMYTVLDPRVTND